MRTTVTCLSLTLFILVVSVKTDAQTPKVINAFYYAEDIVADSHGNLFVTGKNNKIIKITPDGKAYDFAGSPRLRAGSKDDKGTAALFSATRGIAIDGADNLYVADNVVIRKITPDADVTTIYGNNKSEVKDGDATTASFKRPEWIAVDSDGTLYVTDQAYDSAAKVSCNVVRKISGGRVTTIKNEDGTTFRANWINGLTCDKDKNLYVSRSAWSSSIAKITPDERISTVIGKYDTKSTSRTPYKDGDVKTVKLVQPHSIAVDSKGALYFSDGYISKVLKMSNGQVSTAIGAGGAGYKDGKAKEAQLLNPHGIAFDKDDNLYILDNAGSVNSYVRKLSPNGIVSTFCKHEFNAVTKQHQENE